MAPIPDGYGLIVHEFGYPNAAGSMVVTEGVALDGILTEGNVDNIRSAFQLNVVVLLGANLDYLSTTAYVGDVGGGSLVVQSTAEAAGGGRSGDGLTTNTAILVSKSTGLGGRKNKGRLFLPGCTANMQGSANLLDTTFQNSLQAGLDEYFDDLTTTASTGVVVPVILHADASSPTSVGSYVVQTRLATQRGRLRD